MAASSVARFSKKTHGQQHYALFRLPPELRNIIYKLIHTTADTNDDGTIDLRNTKPPTKHLALTCQALYRESHALFKAAFQAYWRHEFTVIASDPPNSRFMSRGDCNVSEADLARINRIQLICRPRAMPGAEWVVRLSKTGSTSWIARLALQDFSRFGTRSSGELRDFYKIRCNRWLAHLGEERDAKLTLSLLPALLWAASRPLLFF